jgi:hypothetical protein
MWSNQCEGLGRKYFLSCDRRSTFKSGSAEQVLIFSEGHEGQEGQEDGAVKSQREAHYHANSVTRI